MVIVAIFLILFAVACFGFIVGYTVSEIRCSCDKAKIRSLEILCEVEREMSGAFDAANADSKRLVDGYKAIFQELKNSVEKLEEQQSKNMATGCQESAKNA